MLDYKDDQLGVQSQHAGAQLIEGAYHCPSMPRVLVSATIDYRAGETGYDTYQARLVERTAYRLRPKQRADNDGDIRLLCPAAGAAPTARCPLKSESMTRVTLGKPTVRPDETSSRRRPKICRQQSSTFPAESFDRYGQALPYGTPAWQATFSTLRNTIEGTNGHVKDDAFEALGASQRRRVRGIAAQTVFAAFLIFGANLRKIDAFLDFCIIDDDGFHRPKRVRRTATSLELYRPIGPTGDPPPDPALV